MWSLYNTENKTLSKKMENNLTRAIMPFSPAREEGDEGRPRAQATSSMRKIPEKNIKQNSFIEHEYLTVDPSDISGMVFL